MKLLKIGAVIVLVFELFMGALMLVDCQKIVIIKDSDLPPAGSKSLIKSTIKADVTKTVDMSSGKVIHQPEKPVSK